MKRGRGRRRKSDDSEIQTTHANVGDRIPLKSCWAFAAEMLGGWFKGGGGLSNHTVDAEVKVTCSSLRESEKAYSDGGADAALATLEIP